MFTTDIHIDRDISNEDLRAAFAHEMHVVPAAVVVLLESDLEGLSRSWANQSTIAVVRRSTIPGEFPLELQLYVREATEVDFEFPGILQMLAKRLSVAVLSNDFDIDQDFMMALPDGAFVTVNTNEDVEDPAIVLNEPSRAIYDSCMHHRAPLTSTA